MKYDILPCPHCGGKAYLERKQRAFIDGESTRVAFVRCTKCHARSGRFKLEDFGSPNHSAVAERKAVEAWNKRIFERRGGGLNSFA